MPYDLGPPVRVAGRKSCAITTARRLGQFLGDERIKDKGLNCNYVVAKRPENLPTSERAIPVAIFSTEPAVAVEQATMLVLSRVPSVRTLRSAALPAEDGESGSTLMMGALDEGMCSTMEGGLP